MDILDNVNSKRVVELPRRYSPAAFRSSIDCSRKCSDSPLPRGLRTSVSISGSQVRNTLKKRGQSYACHRCRNHREEAVLVKRSCDKLEEVSGLCVHFCLQVLQIPAKWTLHLCPRTKLRGPGLQSNRATMQTLAGQGCESSTRYRPFHGPASPVELGEGLPAGKG